MRILILISLFATNSASAQRALPFDRTESWAMARTTVATLFQGVAPPQSIEPGTIRLSAELASIPHVEREDAFVGFNGTKFEDLNKTPVFGRGRLLIGLPWQFGLELAYTPPLEINGVKPDGVYGLALERPVFSAERWQVGIRAFAGAGHVEGDITCPASVASFGVDDLVNNPFGCLEPSNDDAEVDHYGVEFSAAVALRERLSLTAAFAISRLEPSVQINSLLSSGPDLAQLSTEGTVRSSALGLSYQIDPRWQVAASANYTPLEVRRPPERLPSNDDSFNLRVIVAYRLR